MPLGPPQGDAKRNGRDFARKVQHDSVFVDVERRVGKTDWKQLITPDLEIL